MTLTQIMVTPEDRCRYNYNQFLTNYHLHPEEDKCILVETVFSPFLACTEIPCWYYSQMGHIEYTHLVAELKALSF